MVIACSSVNELDEILVVVAAYSRIEIDAVGFDQMVHFIVCIKFSK